MEYIKSYWDTVQREWDEDIMNDKNGKPSPYNCDYCLDYGDNDGEPCTCKHLDKEDK